MRFVADAMLGRLAKWLRLLGFDTLYVKDTSDLEVLRTARGQRRTILTRDTHFERLKGLGECLIIKSEKTAEQLAEVTGAFGIGGAGKARCPECNGPLRDVGEKAEVEGLVPEYVLRRHRSFMKCTDCGKPYWEGSHYRRIRKTLDGLLKDPAP